MEEAFIFSIIIPVLHEEVVINPLITQLYAQFPDDSIEIIVVDGDPTGSTIHIILSSQVITAISEAGRGTQLNMGARLAHGDVLIFLHADTRLPSGALQYAQRILSQNHYAAGAFKLGLDSNRWVFKLIESAASWRYRLAQLPYGDQAFFMTREYFFRIGCFAEIPIMEDLELMRRIKRRKEKIHISKTLKVNTSVRRWQEEGILYAVLRTWLLASLYCLGVSPYKLVKYYHNHEKKREGRKVL